MKCKDKIKKYFSKSLFELSLELGYKSNAVGVWASSPLLKNKKIELSLLKRGFKEDERLFERMQKINEEKQKIKNLLEEIKD